jgi:hypothetical protein
VDHGLRFGDERLCCASVVAVRAWEAKEAAPVLLRLADEHLRRGASRDPAVLYEAARTLARFDGEGVTELLLRCAKDEDWRARLAAAEARTTVALRDDPHPLVRRAARGTEDAPGPVVFVIERPGLDAAVPWGLVVNRARTALRELPPTRFFNVVVFGNEIDPWRKAPVAATGDNVFQVEQWLGRRPHAREPRPLRDALETALGQHGVTAIRLYATGSNDVDMTETLVGLYALNRFQRVRIDTVGLAESELLPAIARQTGGTHRMIR